jgi:SAM-dependent methyltransferase
MSLGPAAGFSTTSPMNPAEFENIARSEGEFWWYRGMRAIFFRLLDPLLEGRRIRRALEAGCGTGYFSGLLEKERGWPMVPLDISWEGLRYGSAMGLERMAQGDVARLPFADAAFDLVISADVLVHLPPGQERAAAREMTRVVARGGLVAVRAAALNILRSRHSAFAFERQRFTRRRLMDLFAETGVRVRRCTYVNSLLLPVALAKFRIWEPLLRRPPASGVQAVPLWLDRALYGALQLEAGWVAKGRNLPLGQSLVLIGEKL